MKAFIFFVFSHCIVTLYGGIVFILALFGEVSKVNDTKFEQFLDVQTGFYAVYQYAWDFGAEVYRFAWQNKLLTCLGSSCFCLGLTLPVFFGYHVRLVLKNRTTNEEMKVKKLKFGLNNQQILFRAIIGKTKQLVEAYNAEQKKAAGQSAGTKDAPPSESKDVPKEEDGAAAASPTKEKENGKAENGAKVECTSSNNKSEERDPKKNGQ